MNYKSVAVFAGFAIACYWAIDTYWPWVLGPTGMGHVLVSLGIR